MVRQSWLHREGGIAEQFSYFAAMCKLMHYLDGVHFPMGGLPNLLLLLGGHNNQGHTMALLLPVLWNASGGGRHQVCDSVL